MTLWPVKTGTPIEEPNGGRGARKAITPNFTSKIAVAFLFHLGT